VRRVPNLSKAKSKVPRGMRTMKMTVAGAARSDSNSEQTGEHIGKCVHFNCPSLSKWLFGIPEQDRSTLEQEARRVAGHSRRIWIKGKGQPNVEEDLKLKLAFIHSLHFFHFSSLEASPPVESSTPVPRSTSTRFTKRDPRRPERTMESSEKRSTI
jgi:hypothetical protein